jgi:hypothetical protein
MKRDTGQAGLLGLDAIGPDAIRVDITPRSDAQELEGLLGLDTPVVVRRWNVDTPGSKGHRAVFGSAARSSRLSVLTETGCGLVTILLGPTANTDVVSKEDAFGKCALGQWQGRCACGACKRMALGGWQR